MILKVEWWVEVNDGLDITSSEHRYFNLSSDLYHNGPSWYVSDNGNDSTGNGSEIYPYNSIQKMISEF